MLSFSTIEDLAKASSSSIISLVNVTSSMEPSTFFTVRITLVPLGPL